ncbi:RILP-like protein 2 [Scyliorhinus canicula]|uniref:RILP-like protein 2 n=1 Tax=Scyliorhinus canicula TaxID=7830 RepID=UPI0018F4656F|nr:RILP-like protein 2 [Scyliorhinus canicula]
MEEPSPASAFDKDPFDLTAEDVYDMSYIIGRDLFKLSGAAEGRTVAELQYKIIRVLEIFEALVDKQSLAAEALRLEREVLRAETERLQGELREARSCSPAEQATGPDKTAADVNDPDRPRFTLQELREVLQERNKLKAQLLAAQEELECYKRGLIAAKEPQNPGKDTPSAGREHERTTVKKLFALKQRKNP